VIDILYGWKDTFLFLAREFEKINRSSTRRFKGRGRAQGGYPMW
jgi:hypothetical protein